MYNKILIGQSTQVLDQGFIQLIDYMGTDDTIVQAARVSFGNEELVNAVELEAASEILGIQIIQVVKLAYTTIFHTIQGNEHQYSNVSSTIVSFSSRKAELLEELKTKDEVLLRLLMRHNHGTPFEMCEVMFRVQVPMDCWRQWIRHRTANVNEYSTRYTEAIDITQTTAPDQWRLQSKDNKQGSNGFLQGSIDQMNCRELQDRMVYSTLHAEEEFPCSTEEAGKVLSQQEKVFQANARKVYDLRLKLGVAKEQARKDLPLSTYTRAYWKCDLRNIFHFLSLRMDSHAQLEIRQYANAMADFIKQLFPVAYKAFEDYQLNAVKFSAMEMELVKMCIPNPGNLAKPDSMTKREWNEFKAKLGT